MKEWTPVGFPLTSTWPHKYIAHINVHTWCCGIGVHTHTHKINLILQIVLPGLDKRHSRHQATSTHRFVQH